MSGRRSRRHREGRSPRSVWLLSCLTLAACDHPAERSNPVDPSLTHPPVSLSVSAHDTTGAVDLTWTPYAGRAPFSAYWVLRKVPGLEAVDTLAMVSDPVAGSFTDSTAREHIPYSYRVSVLTSAGLEVISDSREVAPLQLPAVAIDTVIVDTPAATAQLFWTPYAGPRFASYEIWRSHGGQEEQVASIPDASASTFTDRDLTGNRRYAYRVVVVTDLDERVEGPLATAILHPLVASWPLPLEPDEIVRLSRTEDNRIAALIPGRSRVRLLLFEPDGRLAEELMLYQRRETPRYETNSASVAPLPDLVPRAVGMTFDPLGRRHLLLTTRSRIRLTTWGADGRPESLRVAFPEIDLSVDLGEQDILTNELSLAFLGTGGSIAAFDALRVEGEGAGPVHETFEVLPDWEYPHTDLNSLPEVLDGWLVVASRNAGIQADRVFAHVPGFGRVTDLRIEADLLVAISGGAVFQLGSRETDQPRVRWIVDEDANQLVVERYRGFERRSTASQPVSLLSALGHRLLIERTGDLLTASLHLPYAWSEEGTRDDGWGTVGMVGDVLAVSDGVRRLAISDRVTEFEAETQISEIRQWPDDPRPMGLCLPDQNRVLIGRASVSSFSGALTWPQVESASTLLIGSGAGRDPGEFVFPLSLDRGRDGRIFVLDAGNGRVQAFSSEGAYITSWGSKGAAADQFDFGSGGQSFEFAGSLAIDDDGLIYVADVGNQRIQVFAP